MFRNEKGTWQLAGIDRYVLAILWIHLLVYAAREDFFRLCFSLALPAEFEFTFFTLAVGTVCTVIALFFGMDAYFHKRPKEVSKGQILLNWLAMIGGSCLCVSGGLWLFGGIMLIGFDNPGDGIKMAICGFIICVSGLLLGVKAWCNLNVGFRNK